MHQIPAQQALLEVAFVSRMVDLEEQALARLVGAVWSSNLRGGITGRMRLDGRNVRQIIEGDAATILPLAARILADPRHARIEVTAFGGIEARRFPDWRVDGLARAPAPLDLVRKRAEEAAVSPAEVFPKVSHLRTGL